MVQSVLQAFKIHNAEILFRDDCTEDEFIDVVTDNRVYIPCLYVYNKIDQISIEEVNKTFIVLIIPNAIIVVNYS